MLDLIPYARAMHFSLCSCRILANGRTTEVEIVHPSQGSGLSGYVCPTRCAKLRTPHKLRWVLDLIPYARAMHFSMCFCRILTNGRTTEVDIVNPSKEFCLSGYFGPCRWASAGQITCATTRYPRWKLKHHPGS